jgi:hypothetical protein
MAAAKDKGDQLTLVERGRIRAEKEIVSAPRVALENELQWFGFELLAPAPEGNYYSVGGLERAIIPMNGIWDSVEIWTAGGQVVMLKFVKKQASLSEDSAFRSALRRLLDERLQVSSHISSYSTDYVWEIATETEFLQK